MRVSSTRAKFFLAVAGLAIAAAILIVSLPLAPGPRATVDLAGPVLGNPTGLDGITAYNTAIALHRRNDYSAALAQMKTAVRSRQLAGRGRGFGFANLCVMYWRATEWKQALAACIKAKKLLPGFAPVLAHINGIKSRERIN